MTWKYIGEWAEYELRSGRHENIKLMTDISKYESFEEALKAHKDAMEYYLKCNRQFRKAKLIRHFHFTANETYSI